MNDVDAGVAEIDSYMTFRQGYLASRGLTGPSGTTTANVGDIVYKVGRTTGHTEGEVKSVSTVVGPVGYGIGLCWFRNSLEIEGVGGTTFSDSGDSGSAIVLKGTNEIVGLLYAGNGTQTYACPIDEVMRQLSCTLV